MITRGSVDCDCAIWNNFIMLGNSHLLSVVSLGCLWCLLVVCGVSFGCLWCLFWLSVVSLLAVCGVTFGCLWCHHLRTVDGQTWVPIGTASQPKTEVCRVHHGQQPANISVRQNFGSFYSINLPPATPWKWLILDQFLPTGTLGDWLHLSGFINSLLSSYLF